MKVKKEGEYALKKQEIMDHVEQLIVKHGVSELSMRALAKDMQMTPGIFYHYFKNKDEVLAEIVMRRYGEIISIISASMDASLDVAAQIKQTLRCYMLEMLKRKELYTIMMNSQDPNVSQQTRMLYKGISKERKSIQMLCMQIQKGIEQELFERVEVELSAQCIWCSMYGLLDRLIKEDVEQQQAERLIDHQLMLVLRTLRRG